ncbi:unnamed protein product, partial [Ectocarpus sp. 13 AM-2016]
ETKIFLLDERYDRDTKPCYLRRSYCEKVRNTTSYTVWCTDFLRGGHGGNGSCCQHDEKIFFGWCVR